MTKECAKEIPFGEVFLSLKFLSHEMIANIILHVIIIQKLQKEQCKTSSVNKSIANLDVTA